MIKKLLLGLIFFNFAVYSSNVVKMQTAKTIKLLELIAQTIKNESIKIDNSQLAIDYILEAKSELESYQEEDFVKVAEYNFNILVDIISKLKAKLSKQSLYVPSKYRIASRNITKLEALKNYDRNIKTHDFLTQKMVYEAVNLNKNYINRFFTELAELSGKFDVDLVSKKALTYGGIILYIVSLMDMEDIEELPVTLPVKTVLKIIKRHMGGWAVRADVQHTGTVDVRKSSIAESDDTRSLDTQSTEIIPARTTQPVMIKVTDITPENPEDRKFNRLLYKIQKLGHKSGLFEITREPLFKIPICAMLAKLIGPDVKACYDKIEKQLARASAYAQGKKYEEKKDLKDPKKDFSFDKLVGYHQEKAQLAQAGIYAQYKDLFDLADATINRGYLIHGPLDIAKHLAMGMAYDINESLKLSGKKCKVATLSVPGMLADKTKLTEKIKDLEKDAKTNFVVLLIEDLGHAINHTRTNSLFWSELIDGINSIVNNNKKRFFVVATTSIMEPVLSAVKAKGCLEHVINLELPNAQNRELFIKKQLEKRCIRTSDDMIEQLIHATDNCSFADIEDKIKHSIISFDSTKKMLKSIA